MDYPSLYSILRLYRFKLGIGNGGEQQPALQVTGLLGDPRKRLAPGNYKLPRVSIVLVAPFWGYLNRMLNIELRIYLINRMSHPRPHTFGCRRAGSWLPSPQPPKLACQGFGGHRPRFSTRTWEIIDYRSKAGCI